jgi:lipopolysaccharide/colanic/teichoic acid biosynthesis glycosyltransferase/ribosomal protein S18 acetylase RimI-like enzyme
MKNKKKALEYSNKSSLYKSFLKRPMDFILCLIAIIVLSPVLIVVGLVVRVKLGSPVIFKQKRPGLNEKIFTLYKFRTMTDKRDFNGELLPDSIRLTKVGKFLRSTSLDELPELFNILKGDMSIIGPRPLLSRYVPYYTETERLRHSVRPGLSGLAQINGRNNSAWHVRLKSDYEYVNNISFLLDMKIILKTLIKVFKREGVTVIDQAPLKDLDVERKHFMIKRLGIDDFESARKAILNMLIDIYMVNFQLSEEKSRSICIEKIEQLKEYINEGSAILIGSFDEEVLTGFVWLYERNHFGECRLHINEIAVKEQYRGKGIAKHLMSEAEKYAKDREIETIDLFVTERNNEALNMYRNLGFLSERLYMKKLL